MATAYAAFANGGIYHKPMYINKVVFSDGSEKEFSDPGTRAMKETTAYMMTEMMKTVLTYGTGRGAYLPWLQAGKTGTSNYTDEEIENHIKTTQFVAPDEMFVGYTLKYSMAVWTGYTKSSHTNCGDGLTVAAKQVYRAMMTSLSENDHPGEIGQCLREYTEVVSSSFFERCQEYLDYSCYTTNTIRSPENSLYNK